MKQLLSLLLAAVLLFCLCGCGAKQPTAAPEPVSTPEASAEPETVPEPAETPESSPAVQEPVGIAGYEPDFRFSTTDRDGEAYDESIFAGQTLTMINFWEPWCGPCVSEMPDLEKLYQTYRDKGFLILMAYLLLKAAEMNLDTLVIGIRHANQLRALLQIPEDETIGAVIAVGHRVEDAKRPPRKELDDIARFY